LFGCECEGCGCSGRRELQSFVASNATNATNTTDCTDYYYYMNLTLAEKVARLEDVYCSAQGLTLADSVVRKLEQLAKTNASETTITCQDFKNAYLANITTAESFCMGTANRTYSKFTKSSGGCSFYVENKFGDGYFCIPDVARHCVRDWNRYSLCLSLLRGFAEFNEVFVTCSLENCLFVKAERDKSQERRV
jgi:hypothetical protein